DRCVPPAAPPGSALVPYTTLFRSSQGSLQVLENGDQFIGWGEVGEFSEFGQSGQLLFDGHFPSGTESYRDFRFAWGATPAHRPRSEQHTSELQSLRHLVCRPVLGK